MAEVHRRCYRVPDWHCPHVHGCESLTKAIEVAVARPRSRLQGATGENVITDGDLHSADAAIIAADVGIGRRGAPELIPT